MQSQTLAQRAYSDPSHATRTPRGVEYEAFARATRRMVEAANLGPSGFATLAEALHENRRLWLILAGDVAGADNALPPELRARIFYLAEFTRVHSSKVLKAEATVEPLVENNALIMRGLHQKGPVQ